MDLIEKKYLFVFILFFSFAVIGFSEKNSYLLKTAENKKEKLEKQLVEKRVELIKDNKDLAYLNRRIMKLYKKMAKIMSENLEIKTMEKSITDLEKKIDNFKKPKKKIEQIDEAKKTLEKKTEDEVK
ncbi:MAG: hypothetical protein U9O87_02140 [Verrucomicrobiota bacterium]|nr:hypothetical protein [Verrucomicrobiota bacterium]